MSTLSLFTYHVWCRTEEVAPDQHLVTVVAVPVPPVDGGDATSESRLFISSELATTEGERMVASMTRRLVADGHTVGQVTVVAADRA
jgi:hypothetical protein